MRRSLKLAIGTVIGVVLAVLAAEHFSESFTAGINAPVTPRVQADLLGLRAQLSIYAAIAGAYPTTEQGLNALINRPITPPIPAKWHPLLDGRITDPWNRPYAYRDPAASDSTDFDLFSVGPDGVESGDDIRLPH